MRSKRWEADYPQDPRDLIVRRLAAFLELIKEINYGAALVERDGKKRFADPDLEGKPGEWKLCFRAGRQATEAAREFAAAWLKELGR